MSDDNTDNPELLAETVGARLAKIRDAKGLTLKDVAAKTRVPLRHLQSIENGDYAELPGKTYAIGFAKAYARMIDVPEDDIASCLRAEIAEYAGEAPRHNAVQFEIDEPSKIPSSRLAWVAAIVGLVILIGGFGIWRTQFFPGADDSQYADVVDQGNDRAAVSGAANDGDRVSTQSAGPGAQPANIAAAASADPKGQVVFTATVDNVWVKFYDGNGDQLMQKQMALGERYAVPVDAIGPQIWTGRPDAFDITIGGKAVPKLGDAERAMKDVQISAAALLNRKPPVSSDSDRAE